MWTFISSSVIETFLPQLNASILQELKQEPALKTILDQEMKKFYYFNNFSIKLLAVLINLMG